MSTFDPGASPLTGGYALVNDSRSPAYMVNVKITSKDGDVTKDRMQFEAASEERAKERAIEYFKSRGAKKVEIIDVKARHDADVSGVTHYSLSELHALLKESGASEALKAKVKKEIESRKTKNDAQSLQAILNQIKRSNRLEDRSEYSVQDLMQMYSLNEKDAKELENLIKKAMRGDSKNDASGTEFKIEVSFKGKKKKYLIPASMGKDDAEDKALSMFCREGKIDLDDEINDITVRTLNDPR